MCTSPAYEQRGFAMPPSPIQSGFVSNFRFHTDVKNVPAFKGCADLSRERVEDVLNASEPQVVAHLTGNAPSGDEVNTLFAMIPMTGEMMLREEEKSTVVLQTARACNMLQKLGCGVIGLGSMTGSALTGGGQLVAQHEMLGADVHLTTGNTFSAMSTLRTADRLMERFKLSFDDIHIGVLGATGSIGTALSLETARRLRNRSSLLLVARNPRRLENLLEVLPHKEKIKCSTHLGDVRDVDLLIVATTSTDFLLTSELLKPGMIVIDETQPRNTSPKLKERRDVLIVDGALISTPSINFEIDIGSPPGTAFACLVETMMLGLEGRVTNHFALGNVSPGNFQKMEILAKRYGFDLAPFRSFDEIIPDERFAEFEANKQTIGSGEP